MVNMTNAQAMEALKSATLGINAAFAACGRNVDPDTALDLAQESICNVLESYDPAKATDNGIPGYSYRVGYREALDYLRGRQSGGAQKRRDDEISTTTTDDDGNVADLEIPSSWPSPFDALATKERDSMLRDEIATLPPSQQRAIAATLADESLDNAGRQSKMHAIDTIVSNLPKSMRHGQRSKAKGKKRK